jgi:CBS domain-containing protein
MGYILIVGGILWVIIAKTYFIGPAISFAGMFLENAASDSRRQTTVREILHGATAVSMMAEDYTPIKQQLSIRAAREYIENSGQGCLMVVEKGTLLGIVTLRDVRIPKERWDTSTIGEAMTPINKIKSANPNQSAADILEQMEDYDINQTPVLEEGKLLGVVSRFALLNFLSTRAKLEE